MMHRVHFPTLRTLSAS